MPALLKPPHRHALSRYRRAAPAFVAYTGHVAGSAWAPAWSAHQQEAAEGAGMPQPPIEHVFFGHDARRCVCGGGRVGGPDRAAPMQPCGCTLHAGARPSPPPRRHCRPAPAAPVLARRLLQLERCATGLDGGCVYGGRLYGCILPPLDEKGSVLADALALPPGAERFELCTGIPAWLVSVPARRAYSRP